MEGDVQEVFLGLDAGSSVCKAAAFDTEGRLVALATARAPLERSAGGRVEADPERVWAAATSVLREVGSRLEGRGRPVALGVSGAMVGAWVVDEGGDALRFGINWEDARAGPMLARMEADTPGFLAELFSVSGSVLQQGCTLPVLAVLGAEEPEVLSRAAAVIGLKDWLRARLTGRIATDVSEAAVAPGNARKQGRDAELIARFGLLPYAHLLPEARPSAAPGGAVTHAAAVQTGLPEGLPVAIGAGDVIANVIGAGGLVDGADTALLGTTCMVGRCGTAPTFTPPNLGLLFSLPERHWFRAMVNVAGTANLDWAMSVLCADLAGQADRFELVTELARAEPVGARGVTYLPYLSESGIIAPKADAAARAQFSGLVPTHGRAALLRAIFEGVAFSIADLTDLLGESAAPITLTGGGARSAIWPEMIAEMTGRPVRLPEGAEFGARGAALLAAVSVGRFASVEVGGAAWTPAGRVVEPTGARAVEWADARARFTEARDRLLGAGNGNRV
jgi:sugar (pentulose or hexulose) kinase